MAFYEFGYGFDQAKMCSEPVVKRFSVVSEHFRSIAFCGTSWTECAYDNVGFAASISMIDTERSGAARSIKIR